MDKPLQDPIPHVDPIYIGPRKNENPMPGSIPMLNRESESFIKLPQCDTISNTARSKKKYCSLAKAVKTVAAYGTYLGVGLLMSILGSTLLDLENNTDASSYQMALLYTWQNLGRLPAVLLSGILADKFNKEAQIGVAMLFLAAVSTSFPFCTNYGVLATVVALSGSGLGFIGGGATLYIMSLWDDPSAILGLHLSMSIGSTIGPLIAKSFQSHPTNLSSTNDTLYYTLPSNSNISTFQSMESPFIIEDNISLISSNSSQGNLTVNIFQFHDKDLNPELIYPYLIMGIFDTFIALIFLVLFFMMFRKQQHVIKKNVEASKDKKQKMDGMGRAKRLITMSLYCMFLFLSGGVEIAYGGLVVIYAYKTLNFSKSSSSVVNAAFFGAISAGRIFGIFITRFGYLRVNIGISITLGVIGMVGLSTLATFHVSIIWISSVLIGIALSTTVSNVLVITKRSLKGSSRSTSTLMFSIYLGMMLVPAAAGNMFKLWGMHIFPHTMLAGLSMMVLLFAITVLTSRSTNKTQ